MLPRIGGMRWGLASLVLAAACTTAPRAPGGPAGPPREPLAAGFAALAAGRFDEAAERFNAVAPAHPPIADYADYFRARAAARAGDDDAARAAIARLLTTQADSVWAGSARLLDGELALRAGDAERARASLAAAGAVLPAGSTGWARATLALARLEADRGEPTRGVELAETVRRSRPRALAARRARRLVDRLRAAHPELPPPDPLEEAEQRLREGDAGGARAWATQALARDGDRAPALWALARAERGAGDRSAAERTCLALVAEQPDHPLAPRALAGVAGWRWNADDDAGAAALFEDVTRRWPTSAQAPDALYALGRIAQESGRYDAAHQAYAGLAARYADVPLAAEAAWRAGWVRWLAARFGDAERAFAAVAARADGTAQAGAAYWRARALDRLGRPGDAEAVLAEVAARHPLTYYARLAEAQLGRSDAAAEPPAAPPLPPFPATLTGPHAERARALAALGFTGFARRELDAIDPVSVPALTLLDAYASLGAASEAIRLARRLEPTTGTDAVSRHLYPLGYWHLVRPAAHARGVDPFLVVGLIRQESLFDPHAASAADARGLMQLLPSTAATLAPDGARPTRSALHDPATNVDLGVTLLARLLERYGGSRVRALAAYNAGADAVAKWNRRYAGRDEDEFVELISYRETRDYVKAVLRNERIYRQLYAAPPASPQAATRP